MFGKEIYRITARKDSFGEVEEFICDECRFEKKSASDWVIEGPRRIERNSVISANHYEKLVKPSIIHPLEEKMEKRD
jgi:NADH-quinone oxidoreductase subunit G